MITNVCVLDVAQGNFSEEFFVPQERPTQKEGSVAKDQDPLRPELPSTTSVFVALQRVPNGSLRVVVRTIRTVILLY